MNDIGFLLKQLITFFVEPFGLVFTLFLIGLVFLYRAKFVLSKLALSASFSCLLLFSYPPFSNYLVKNLENRYKKFDYTTTVKYIHVLGNGHNTDNTQPISSQISSAGVKRVLEGIILHKSMKGSKIIFTGYAGKTDTSNAVMNARLAKALGVKDQDMIIVPHPKDTAEEVKFDTYFLKGKKFIVVTSATHMSRAMKLFKLNGLDPIPAPTNFYKKEISTYLVMPNLISFYHSKIAMHEYIGILWIRLKSYIR